MNADNRQPGLKNNPGAQQMSEELYREGLALLARRRFADAMDRFEDALQLDRRNPDCYCKMGIAALYQDDLTEAKHCFNRALQLDRDNVEAMNGLAYVDLRESRTADAADRLCDVLKIDAGNRYARRNFNLIKEAENLEILPVKLHPNQFVSLPGRRSGKPGFPFKLGRIAALLVLAASLMVLVYTMYRKDLFRFFFARQRNAGTVSSVPKYDYYYPVNAPLSADLKKSFARATDRTADKSGPVLSVSEAEMMITRARQLHNNREYNEARYLLNRLKQAQVDPSSLKDAEELSKFNRDPDYDKLKFNPSAGKVVKEPENCRDLSVKWLAKTVSDAESRVLVLTPSRYQADGVSGIRLVVLGEHIPHLEKGRQVEIFGKILGVDKALTNNGNNIFIHKRNLKILH